MSKVLYDVERIDAALTELVDAGELRSEQASAVHDQIVAVAPQEPDLLARGVAAASLAAAYIGVGLVLAAVATLLGQNWEDMTVLGRTAAFLVITVVLLVAGRALRARFDAACGLAWLAAVVSSGGIGGAIFSGDGFNGDTTFLAATLSALAVAVVLLVLRQGPAQLVGAVAAAYATVMAVAGRFDLGPGVGGLMLWLLGIAVAVAALRAWLPAQQLALALGGLIALIGTHFTGAESLLLATGLALALASSGYAVALRRTPAVPLTIATLTVATTGPRILGQWLHGSLGAAGVLALSGLIVLGAAAAHVQLTRDRTSPRS